MNLEDIKSIICRFIKDEVRKRNQDGVVIGVSGGIDSAVVAYLAVNALGNDKVLGLIMPDKDIDYKNDIEDAILICKNLGIKFNTIYINDIKNSFLKYLDDSREKLLIGNLVARIRMCLLYHHSGLLNRIVLGTSNKTELMTGYFTKYGDGASDLLPVGGLYKTKLVELAKHLDIPISIINKKSSARLWNDQLTEEELGLSFETMDNILNFIDNRKEKIDLMELENNFPQISNSKLERLTNLINKNSHKTLFPSICKINNK